ncbi:MAG: hypothetical protein ACR2M1_10695 [Gemmatimonadaceae bacterium]
MVGTVGVAVTCTLVCTAVFAGSARAQGTLSSQSLGYPPGQLSTRAEGTAGALGDIDGRSPINPAALVLRPVPEVYAQYDPELRSVTGPGGTSSTTTARFPNVGVVLPVNRRFVMGASASTLLDRTWATQTDRTQMFGTESVSSTESLRSEGGITDLRLAAGYTPVGRLRVGLGLHGYTGSTRVTSRDVFADTLRYRNISQTTSLSYSGTAISGGLIFDIVPQLSVAVSARKGGSATMYAGDSVLSHGRIPDRYSGTVSFQGLPGTLIAVRGSRERWTEIASLSTLKTPGVDATDYSVGLESAGPRVGGLPLLIRAGARRRTLPFTIPGMTSDITETSFGGGLGVPIALDRVTLDLAVLRSSRTGVAGIQEHAYNLSFGLQVHP